MNKIKDAFDYIVINTNGGQGIEIHLDCIRDWIECSIPKKPKVIDKNVRRFFCGCCGKRVKTSWKACPVCMNVIDWRK